MKLCMGCMNQIEEHLFTCPYCGFNETTLRQESYCLDPGTIVGGKYIVGKVMSYGGHTVSYLGMDAEVNRKVVVKEYLPSDFSTRSEGEKEVTIYSGDGQEQFEQGLTNFLNEANRIQQLRNSEGIAKIYDCIVENETGYVISEYIEGHALKEILDLGKKYSVKEARAFIKSILNGLSKVHHLNIVHCDISPETIMVTDSGEIKLLDFGATRYVTTANSKSLSIILKRGYAPEEQYRSRGVRGPWTDVYALAAVMYRMITGLVPPESVERVLVDELKEPSKLGISIPENIENALMNALNVYQEERTPSAEVFLRELNSRTVKRIKVKKRKNKTGKFPVWAKCLVAGLFCVVAVGGVILYNRMSANKVGTVGTNSVALNDLNGMKVEEAEAYIAKLNSDNGWNIQLDTENYIFDLNPENDETICNQSVEASTVLSDPKTVEKVDGLEMNSEEKVTGTIVCTRYSSEKLHYSEISKLNAYAMAKKLGIDTKDTNRFKKVEKNNTNYYDLVEIQTKDGIVSAKELKDPSNADIEITYDDNEITITYYASEFFYWESLDSFEEKNLAGLPAYETYEMENETKRKKTGNKKKLQDTSLVDDSYYTFSSRYDEGDIVEQTQEAGTELDTSQGMDEALLYAIGTKFTYGGQTGAQVKAKLDGWSSVNVRYSGSEDPSQEALDVAVQNSEGRNISYFRKGQPLTIIIRTKEKPVPKIEKESNKKKTTGSGSKKKKKTKKTEEEWF